MPKHHRRCRDRVDAVDKHLQPTGGGPAHAQDLGSRDEP